MAAVHNPVIRGFNPDPSICKVGPDYYLVTSTFEFFPGVPIYHSRDLINWELIGHCLTRASQLHLEGCRASGGIYAPTLRYHDGLFYMTTTNVTDQGHLVVHAASILGPWSDPVWVDQNGIDPSLLFTEGKCYFTSSSTWEGRQCILQCEIDPMTGEKLAPSRPVSYGTGGKYPEAPHLYKINDMYYLMLAEGGTEYGHMVTMLRSRDPYGPFEECPHNPIVSHRGIQAVAHPFQCIGHADLTQDDHGQWWIVTLGIRPLPGVLLHNLGRETLLGKVSWDANGWPKVNGCGLMTETVECDGVIAKPKPLFYDNFSGALNAEYCFIRNPQIEHYRYGHGSLMLTGGKPLDCADSSPTFMGIRQKEWRAAASVTVEAAECGMAGITAFYGSEHHYDLALTAKGTDRKIVIRKRLYDLCEESAVEVGDGPVQLLIEADEKEYTLLAAAQGKAPVLLGQGAVAGLCTECTRTMTFTGVFLGLFCEAGQAVFRDFTVNFHGNVEG